MKITLLENDSINLEYTFLIEGISNTLIKKLENYIIKEITLHPLENLKKEHSLSTFDSLRASKYIITTKNILEHEENIKALEKLRVTLQADIPKNIKNLIPEVYKRNITCKLDLRNLKKFININELENNNLEEKELSKVLFKAFPKASRNLLEEEKE